MRHFLRSKGRFNNNKVCTTFGDLVDEVFPLATMSGTKVFKFMRASSYYHSITYDKLKSMRVR